MARNASAEIRRRPKDRKAQIARAAAEAFSELGYHGVSMEAIAALADFLGATPGHDLSHDFKWRSRFHPKLHPKDSPKVRQSYDQS